MRFARAALLPVLALVALTGCGGDNGQDAAASTTSASSPKAEKSAPSTSPGSPSSPEGASPGQVPRPDAGTCQPVAESPDGRYDLGDLGQVTLRKDDPGALTLNVRSGGGWSTSVNSNDDHAQVRFTRGEEEVTLEGDVEGGVLAIRICDGDAD